MSKKKTPQEKKEAEYERKNIVSFHHGKSTRKGFRVQKRLASKKLRSKTGEIARYTRGMNCNMAANELDEVTSALIKNGLSKKRIFKSNVLSLREKVRKKTEARASRHKWNIEQKTNLASFWRRRLEHLLAKDNYSDSSIKDVRDFLSTPRLQDLLGNEPIWRQRLETWLQTAEKAARRSQASKSRATAGVKKGTSEILPG
jgi:hypothetical protein